MMAVSGNSRDRAAMVVVVPGMFLNAETRRLSSYGSRRDGWAGAARTRRFAPRAHSAAYPLFVGILPERFSMADLMVVPRVVKARTQATAISAAATAYSESSKPVSSLMNFLIISLFLEVCLTLCEGRRDWCRPRVSRARAYGLAGILPVRLLIAFLMVVPRVVKARTQATAISAAATA